MKRYLRELLQSIRACFPSFTRPTNLSSSVSLCLSARENRTWYLGSSAFCRYISRKLPFGKPQLILSLCAIKSSTLKIEVSIRGKVRKATRLPEYVATRTITTSHHIPISMRALSLCGRYIPPGIFQGRWYVIPFALLWPLNFN